MKDIESNAQISVVHATINKSGLKITTKTIDVVEHNKCYDAVNKVRGKKSRYTKSNMGVIKTNLLNTIQSESPTLGYHVICKMDDVEFNKRQLVRKIEEKVRKLELGLTSLKDSLKEYNETRS